MSTKSRPTDPERTHSPLANLFSRPLVGINEGSEFIPRQLHMGDPELEGFVALGDFTLNWRQV